MHSIRFTPLPAKLIFGSRTIAEPAGLRVPREGAALVAARAPAKVSANPALLEQSKLRKLIEHEGDGRPPA